MKLLFNITLCFVLQEKSMPNLASHISSTTVVPFSKANSSSAANAQTQTESFVVACVKVNTGIVNSQANRPSNNNEELKIMSVESCLHDRSNDVSVAENCVKNRHSLLKTASSEKIQTLLTSGVVTMPSTLDPTLFNDKVLDILTKSFLEFPYPPHQRLKKLAASTNLSVTQLKNWFTNIRLQNGVSWDPDEIHDAWSYLIDLD